MRSLCVFYGILYMGRVREALVATGLLPHVNLYFMMSCCSGEAVHDTWRENVRLIMSMFGRWGVVCAQDLGQGQLCHAI